MSVSYLERYVYLEINRLSRVGIKASGDSFERRSKQAAPISFPIFISRPTQVEVMSVTAPNCADTTAVKLQPGAGGKMMPRK